MKRAWLRSLIFNIAFYSVTATLSILYIPALLLPRQTFVVLVRFWLRVVLVLEYGILGLKYKIVGLENLPEGSYIIAAKHQSAYETLKLHLIFHDPAIILKKELLSIPLFGAYLKKSGAIAIDRSTPENALRSVQLGVLRVKEEGRPIVIFPQGTRVAPGVRADYKPGIVRIQDVTDLPIIPMALNSGVFWPRNSWLKSPGRVTFQIMHAIQPGKDRQTLMMELEEKIEGASDALVAEARAPRHGGVHKLDLAKKILMIALIIGACGSYMWWWKKVEERVNNAYVQLHPDTTTMPTITGFPLRMEIVLPAETLETPDGTMVVKDIFIQGFPLPLAPVTLTTGALTLRSFRWSAPLMLEGVEAYLSYWNDKVTIKDSLIKKADFRASISGTVDLNHGEIPVLDLVVRFLNHQRFLNELAQNGIIDQQAAMFMSAGFTTLQDAEGIVSVPVTQRERTLYAGPFAFAELPEPPKAAPLSAVTDILPAPSP